MMRAAQIEQVREVVADILSERLAKHGYKNAEVVFAEDFDGEEIIRVKAFVTEPIENVDELYESVSAIRNELEKQFGDDRFVFLSQTYPGDEYLDDDEADEDEGGEESPNKVH